MKFVDLNALEPDSLIEADLCIVGTGPAGLSIANEFAGTDTRVVVVESGGLEEELETQALYEIESTGAPRIVEQERVRTRVVGGSSHVWTGRCAPFDELDFAPRPWIPYSGWPIKRAELEPYFDRAAKYLALAPEPYDERLWKKFQVDPPRPGMDGQSLRPIFWQYSPGRNRDGHVHFGREWVTGADDKDSSNIEIVLHANVTQINLSPDGARFASVDVCSLSGKRAQVRANTMVLCCGGIENARLLLASNRTYPAGIGNQNDLVGRFLMDHVTVTVGSFDLDSADAVRARFGHYWLDDAQGRHVYLHGLGLSERSQEQDNLLNCHAYLDISDPTEDSPWAALKRLTSGVRSGRISGFDAWLVLSHLGQISAGLLRRRFRHRPQLEPVSRVEIQLILEQMPDPESRVTLSSDKTDALGMPISRVHWKISETERRTAQRIGQLLAEEMQKLGLPSLQGIPAWNDQGEWVASCVERAHPTGTTRMATDPKQGVVDANCQIHAVDGLFVAGSSVFPTTGAANPTMMIVAMAVRLADHLKAMVA